MGRRNNLGGVVRFRKRRDGPAPAIAVGMVTGILLGVALLILTPFFVSVGDTLPHTIMREAGTMEAPTCASVLVHDGDTFRCDGIKVRLVAKRGPVDAPEKPDSLRCAPGRDGWCDTVLAERARERLSQLLQPGAVQVDCKGYDRHGRALCTASVDGRDAGDTLVAEGLAMIVERWR